MSTTKNKKNKNSSDKKVISNPSETKVVKTEEKSSNKAETTKKSKTGKVLLTVNNLCMYFDSAGKRIKASENVSFDIYEGETFGLVGESGSGKSTIGKCIIGLNTATSGSIKFLGTELTGIKSHKEYNEKMRDIQMIFQDPMSSLNPKKKVGDILMDALNIQKIGSSKEEREKMVKDALTRVGIPVEYMNRYPRSFSGGQRQRIGIARALAGNPKLVIADECIAALDASVQAQIVNLLRKIKEEMGTSFLFISHDLSMVRFLSERIGVLHLGYLLETGSTEEIYTRPIHPYTRRLLAATPRLNPIIQPEEGEVYDYASSGIHYGDGSWHELNKDHKVFCTDQEFKKWVEETDKERGQKGI